MKTKKINYIWFAPFITFAILLVLYALAGIYPFGKFSTAFSDGINQYVPMLAEFSRKIKTGSTLFYTWTTASGTNFWSNFTYYLASPLNLISLFYKETEMYKAFSLITLLKPVLMALTFGIFLKHRYNKNDLSIVIFSILWAFSGFMISSMFLTAWYDAIIYFPLVILGLQRMMDGYSGWLYSLFLGLTIISNFYIGWMVCIFCVIYFIYTFLSDDEVVYEGVTAPKEETEKTEEAEDEEASINIFAIFKNSYLLSSMFRFAFSSLLGGAISAICTLPTVYALQNTGKGTIEARTITFGDIWGILASHVYPMDNIYSTLTSVDIMFCFVGILSLILCIAYFFTKGISVRKKIGNLFLLAIMWVSIIFHTVYFIWHGFGEPAGVMYRFAFLYSFVLIKIAFEMFAEVEKISFVGIALSLVATGICTFGLYKNAITNLYFWSSTLVITIIAFAVLFAVMLVVIKKKPQTKKAISVVLTILVIAESFVLNIGHINKTDMTEVYTGHDTVMELISNRNDYDVVSLTNKDNGFNEMMTYGLAYGYRGLETYTSMADNSYVLSASDMGAYGNRLNSENGATETTPVFNLMFPTKYVVDGSGRLNENSFHKKVAEKDGYTLYENNYTMPFMYSISGNIGLWKPFSFPVVVDNINEVFKQATGTTEDVAYYNFNGNFAYSNCEQISTVDKVANDQAERGHEHTDGEVNNDEFWNYLQNRMVEFAYRIDDVSKPAYITYQSVALTDGIMYIFVDTMEFVDMQITINGETTNYYTYGFGENRTYEIGEVKKGDVATITIGGKKMNSDGTYNDYVAKEGSFAAVGFTIDMDTFRKGYEKVDAMSDTEMLEFSDGYVKAKVNVYEDSALYIPITSDNGWTVTVDGEEVELYPHESHIMMFAIDAGEHIIEMKYVPQGFTVGAIVTCASILILIAWAVISKKRNDKLKVCDTIEENVKED